MRERAPWQATLEICLILNVGLMVDQARASPIVGQMSTTAPGGALQPAPLSSAGATEFVGRPWSSTDGAADLAPRTSAASSEAALARNPGHESGGRPVSAPGRVAAWSAAVVAVEEDPKVDLSDVARSVFRSTADAVPWLHLVPPHPGDRRLARLAAEREASVETSLRFDDGGNSSREGSSRATGQGGAVDGVPPPLLSHEVLAVARELIANPLAWMLGFLAALVVVTLSFVRRGGRAGD